MLIHVILQLIQTVFITDFWPIFSPAFLLQHEIRWCLLLFHTFYRLVLSSSILLSLVPASTFFGLPKKSSLNTKQQRWKYSSENVWNKFINVINSIYCWLFTMSILEAIMIGLGENWKWKKKKLNKYQATKWTFALQLFSASTIMKNASEW